MVRTITFITAATLFVSAGAFSCAGSSGEPDAVEDVGAEVTDTTEDQGTFDASMPDPATVQLRGSCTDSERWGVFEVANGIQFGSVSGYVANGVVPQSIPDEVLREGNCRLLRRRHMFCNPPCDSAQTCDTDGTCVDRPANQNAGTVRIDGLHAAVKMESLPPGNNYFFTRLDNPPFDNSGIIRLRSTEGYAGKMLLHGVGVEPLVADSGTWMIQKDRDLQLSWSRPQGVVRSTVEVVLTVDQHGNTPVTLKCTLDDTGSGVIPASFINALIDSGVSGFPNGRLVRQTIDSTAIASGGCVEFLVTSTREASVRVSGYTPCDKQEDCPDGQTCDLVSHLCG